MIDLHVHILPGLDDGPRSWEAALQMARLAVADGITTVTATPHLFARRVVEMSRLNDADRILAAAEELRRRLKEADISLEVAVGCEAPLCPEMLELLEEGRLLTVNGKGRYLFLEMPETAIPPATEDICFRLISRGLTPILTHPERHPLFRDRPERLAGLVKLGCLAQITAGSITGDFGWRVSRFTRKLLKAGLVTVVASDAHDSRRRPPRISPAVARLRRWLGESQAQALVLDNPAKILAGQPLT
ncbi:MAG: hypothetical protein K6T55_07255 [Syntrophobacterales bacterium]|nr:hypothetical protein [Syntrophobacterales bacterium]